MPNATPTCWWKDSEERRVCRAVLGAQSICSVSQVLTEMHSDVWNFVPQTQSLIKACLSLEVHFTQGVQRLKWYLENSARNSVHKEPLLADQRGHKGRGMETTSFSVFAAETNNYLAEVTKIHLQCGSSRYTAESVLPTSVFMSSRTQPGRHSQREQQGL